MKYLAPRRCVEIYPTRGERQFEGHRSIEDFRDFDTFVLLGDPGMGKTTVFAQEAKAIADGVYITARDFICLEPRKEWRDVVLFIDGLDEIRAGGKDGRSVLDQIRTRLDRLGRPRFRLSCRWSAWYGSNDCKHLRQVSPDGELPILMLAPLTDSQVSTVLENEAEDGCDRGISASARSAGAGVLLSNPLNLKLTALPARGGSVPDNQRKLMEWACDFLLKEHNEEHRIASVDLPASVLRMKRAGYLSALLILTNTEGFSLGLQLASGYLALEDVPEYSSAADRSVVTSRLFRGIAEGLFAPVHRHLAEFLAARYIADRLADGLPFDRWVALVAGDDGTPQPVFHGLVAWLAELCPTVRQRLISLAPLTIISNADLDSFERHEIRQLLNELLSSADCDPRAVDSLRTSDKLGLLLEAGTANDVFKLLSASKPDNTNPARLTLLTAALRQTARFPNAAEPLFAIVRDERWDQNIRLNALHAAIHQLGRGSSQALDALERLSEDIERGEIADEFDYLLGAILPRLYPQSLGPRAIVRHLHTPRMSAPFSAIAYLEFWAIAVVQHSSHAELTEFLDALAKRHAELWGDDKRAAQTVRELILRVLEIFLDDRAPIATSRQLFNWIGIAGLSLQARTYDFGPSQEEEVIRAFLAEQPEVCLELSRLQEMQDHSPESPVLAPLRFLDHPFPSSDHPARAAGRSCDQESARAAKRSEFADARSDDLGILASPGDQNKASAGTLTDLGQEVLEYLEHPTGATSADEPSGLQRIPQNTLHQIAAAYFDLHHDAYGPTPQCRLRSLLGEDQTVIAAILDEFRRAALNSDTPTEHEILQLISRNLPHNSMLPCLAGLSEIADVRWRDDARLRRAVAVYFATRRFMIGPSDALPAWFAQVVQKHPILVAEVYRRFVTASWAGSSLNPPELARLLYDRRFEHIAERIILPLLGKLPVRSPQLYSLMHLLHGALRLCPADATSELIDQKISAKSMTNVQRVWWLTAGLWMQPPHYAERLSAFIQGNQRHVEYLSQAIRLFQSIESRPPPPEAIMVLVQLMAPWHKPPVSIRHFPSAGRGGGATITRLLETLLLTPSSTALRVLEQLADDPGLPGWHDLIRNMVPQLRARLSKWLFQPADTISVAATLANREPTNAQDLMALTTDTLRQLAHEIRRGSTSDWHQYWNVDQYGRPDNPRPENSCRNALASILGLQLRKWNVSVQIEGVHANDTRSDILIGYGNFRIPVEIKRSCHPNVKSALHDQLIGKYCLDPDSHGFGLYMVLWFGDTQRYPPTPFNGTRPQTADELQSRLIESLNGADRTRIAVVVVDVSQPGDGPSDPASRPEGKFS